MISFPYHLYSCNIDLCASIAIVLFYVFLLFFYLAALNLITSCFMQLFGFVTLDFLISVRSSLFSHFDLSVFLWKKKKISCVSVVDKVNKASLSSGMFFCQFRTKHTHTLNHAPTKLRLCNMSTHCRFLSGDANVLWFSLRMWCKGQRKATASPHPSTNFVSKVRDSPATLTYWLLKKPLEPVFSSDLSLSLLFS